MEQEFSSNASKKKGMKKSAKIILLVLSILFFLAAIVTPIVIFAVPGENQKPETQLGNFILRYDAQTNRYDIVRYIGDDSVVVVPREIKGVRVRAILPNAFDASLREFNTKITKVVIEDGVSSIGENAFKDCSSIDELTLPQSLSRVERMAFAGSGLKTLSVKDASTLNLMPGALDGAESLKTLNIIGATDKLGSGSLSNISGVTDVIIGSGVDVDAGAFTGADSVTSLTVYNYSNLFVSEDAFVSSKITTLNIRKVEENLDLNFMNKFSGLIGLETINVDKEIKNIKAQTFVPFTNLKNLTLGDNVTIDVSALPKDAQSQFSVKVGFVEGESKQDFSISFANETGNAGYNTLDKKFVDCFDFDKISKVTLSENFTTISDNAFAAYVNLREIDFGANSKVSLIGSSAFGGAVNLQNLAVYGPTYEQGKPLSKVYEEFNMSKGTYHARHSYNGIQEIGSYYVVLDFLLGVGNNPKYNEIKPEYAHGSTRIEIFTGTSILASLPMDKIVLNSNGEIDKGASDMIASGWKIAWSTDAEGRNILASSTLMSKDFAEKTIYAVWNPDNMSQYKTEYYLENLAGDYVYSGYYKVSTGVTGSYVDPVLYEKGFVGFTENLNISDKNVRLKGDDSTVLKLYYSRNVYNITLNLNDKLNSVTRAEFDYLGLVEGTDYRIEGDKVIVFAKFEGEYPTLPNVERKGYSFLGWFTAASGGDKVTAGSGFGRTEDIELFAQYQVQNSSYKIEVWLEPLVGDEYELSGAFITGPNGGVVLTDTLVTYDASEEVIAAILAALELSDRDLIRIEDISAFLPKVAGFELDREDSRNVLGALANGDGETTLKLYYKRLSYLVKYDFNEGNGSTSAEVVGEINAADRTFKFGESYILPTLARAGYTFNGFNTMKNGQGSVITSSDKVPTPTSSNREQTLYAMWTANQYTVIYNNNGGAGEMENSVFTFDRPSNLRASTFTKVGYTFANWNTAADGTGETYSDRASVSTLTTEGEVTLFALYVANKFTVVFASGNALATGSMENMTYTYNEPSILPEVAFALNGHSFLGWRYEGREELILDKADIMNLTSENGKVLTLTAEWSANVYSVRYNSNFEGGAEAYLQENVKFGQAFNLLANRFTRGGYNFAGWALSNGGNVAFKDEAEIVNSLAHDDEAVVDLYAVWAAKTYTVTVYSNNTNATEDSKVVDVDFANPVIELKGLFVNPGYEPIGFALSADGDVDLGLSASLAEWILECEKNNTPLNLYVKWSEGKASVTVEYYLQKTDLTYGSALSYVITDLPTGSEKTITAKDVIDRVGAQNFVGFVLDEKAGNVLSVIVEGDGSSVLKVYFARKTFDIEYNYNKAEGSTGTITPETLVNGKVVYGLAFGELETLTRPSYTFGGWALRADSNVAIKSTDIMNNLELADENGIITVYAIWQKQELDYSVIHHLMNLDGTTYRAVETQTFSALVDTEVTALTKSFNGFSLDAEKTGELSRMLEAGKSLVINIYYKRDKHVVHVMVAENETSALEYFFEQEIDLAAAYGAQTINGHTFKAWMNADNQVITTLTMGTSDITIHAQLEENSYTINIDPSSGQTQNGTFSQVYAFVDGKFTIKYLSSVALSGLNKLVTREGYTLLGFAYEQNSTSVDFDINAQSSVKAEEIVSGALSMPYPAGEVTLYAVWSVQQFTVTYTSEQEEPQVQTKDFNETFELLDSSVFTKKGYTFTQWQDKKDGKLYNVGSEFTFAEARNYELSPKWIADKFDVVFNSNVPSITESKIEGSVESLQLTYDATATLAANGYSLKGYKFSSWNTQADGSGKRYEASATLAATSVNELYDLRDSENQVTLYAIWTPITYTLKVISNHVSNLDSEKTVTLTYDQEFVLKNSDDTIGFSFAGYTMIGWSTTRNGSPIYHVTIQDGEEVGEKIKNLKFEEGATYTLYAVWEAQSGIKYTVEHYKEALNGSYVLADSVESKAETGTTVKAEWKAYAGFTQDKENANNILTGVVVGDGSLVLRLYYSRNSYSISFNTNENGQTGDLGGDELTTLTFKYEQEITGLPVLTKNGYTVNGWFTESSAGLKIENGDKYSYTDNITLYAQYTAKSDTGYTVDFYFQNVGGDYIKAFSKALTQTTDTDIKLETIRAAGENDESLASQFVGFKFDHVIPENVGKVNGNGDSLVSLYYVRVEYQVTIVLGEGVRGSSLKVGSGAAIAGTSFTVKFGESLVVSASAEVGYTIARYTLDGASTTGSFTMPAKNITISVFANANSYKIIFDKESGSLATGVTEADLVKEVKYNESFDILSAGTLVKTGYTLDGFTLNGKTYALGAAVTMATLASELGMEEGTTLVQEITFVAHYSANSFTIKYAGGETANGKTPTGSVADSHFTYDAAATLSENGFAILGYHFAGWEYGGKIYQAGASVQNLVSDPNAVVTFTATWEANQYTVTYNANYEGGSAPEAVVFTFDAASNKIAADIARHGYTFKGWDKNREATVGAYNEESVIDNTFSTGRDVTLYAIWSANEFNVTFNGNGNTNEEQTMQGVTFTYDESNTLPSNVFVKTGYDFLGWNTDKDATVALFRNGSATNNELYEVLQGQIQTKTLYAIWSAKTNTKYVVEYYLETLTEGTYDPSPVLSVDHYGTTDTLAAIDTTKTFKGFTLKANQDFSKEIIKGDETLVVKVFYTRNSYDVVYNANISGETTSKTATVPEKGTIKFGEAIGEARLSGKAERMGYDFVGWYLDSSCANIATKEYVYEEDEVLNLYAKYTAKEVTYTIEYLLQDFDKVTYVKLEGDTESLTDFADKIITVDAKAITGFKTPQSQSVVIKADGSTVITFRYERESYNLILTNEEGIDSFTATGKTAETNGKDVELETIEGGYSVLYGTYVFLESTAKEGYTKAGYASVSQTRTESEIVSPFMMEGGLKVVAKATANTYNIIYNSNGGQGTITNQSIVYASSAILSNGAEFTKADYTLRGFAFAGNAETAVLTLGQQLTTREFVQKAIAAGVKADFESGDIVVYAVWERTTFYITYVGFGDEQKVVPVILGETANYLGTEQFSRVGYHYSEWLEDGAKHAAGSTFTVTAADRTLVADWVRNEYTVTYNPNFAGGQSTSVKFVYDSDNNILSSALSRAGYEFLGWHTDKDASVQLYAAGENVANALSTGDDVTLYAIWKANTYKITFDLNGGEISDEVLNSLGFIRNEDGTFYKMFTYDAPYGELPRPTKGAEGQYSFTDWMDAPDGDASYIESTTIVEVLNDNMVYYARYASGLTSVTAKFVSTNFDGSELVLGTKQANVETDSTRSFVPNTFIGFTIDATQEGYNASTGKYTYTATTQEGETEVILVIYYTRNTYSVTIDTTAGLSGITAVGAHPTGVDRTFYYGDTITVSATGKVLAGYHFGEFAAEGIDGQLNVAGLVASFTLGARDAVISVSAVANDYQITFSAPDLENSEVTSIQETITATFDQEIGTLKSAVAAGYTFLGYYVTIGDSEVKLDANSKNLISDPLADGTSTINATAKFSAKTFVVHYAHGEGVTGTMPSETFTFADKTATLSANAFAKKGYHFLGWNTTLDATTATIADKANIFSSFTSYSDEVTIYAIFEIDSYNIEFVISPEGTGTVPSNQVNVMYNEKLEITATANSGYHFVKWLEGDRELGTHSTITYTVPARENGSTITLTAVFAPNVYVVKYDANYQGGVSLSDAEFTFGANNILKTMTPRTGYVFLGWDENKNAATPTYAAGDNFNQPIAHGSSVTLYAIWRANSYTLKYMPNGGTLSEETKIVSFNDIYGDFAVPTYKGYVFGGWTLTDGNLSTKISKSDTVLIVEEDGATIEIYAYWTKDSFDLNATTEGEGSNNIISVGGETLETPVSSMSVIFDEEVILKATASAGYHFEGWYIGDTKLENGDVYAISIDADAKTSTISFKMASESLSVKAKFVKDTYTLQLNTQTTINGVITTTHVGGTVTGGGNYAFGEKPTLKATTAEGYNFAGWYIGKDKISSDANFAFEITAQDKNGATIQVVAKFTANRYTVTLDVNGGDELENSSITVYYDGAYGALPTSTKTGYTQSGWFTAATGGDKISSETIVKITANQTLYAQYTANKYQVNFSHNYETTTPPQINSLLFTYDGVYSELNPIERAGYNFLGWFTAVSGGNQIQNGDTVKITEETTLYAHWEAKTFTVTFDANGGAALDPNSKQVTYDAAYGALPTPTFEGHTFLGWFTLAEGGSKVDEKSIVNISADQTLYAHWSTDSHQVVVEEKYQAATSTTVLGNISSGQTGGTVAGAGSYDFGSKAILTATAKKGFIFDGFYSTKTETDGVITLSGKLTSELTYELTMGTESVTIYALFVQAKIEFTVDSKTYEELDDVKYQAISGNSVTFTGFASAAATNSTEGLTTGYVYYGREVELTTSISDENKDAYHFDNYYTDSNYETLATTGVSWYQPKEDGETLYAKFIHKVITVRGVAYFKTATTATTLGAAQAGNNGGTIETQKCYYGGSVTLTAVADSAKGYIFAGFYASSISFPADDNLKEETASLTLSNLTESLTRYALFIPQSYEFAVYTYTLGANGPTTLNTEATESNLGGTISTSSALTENKVKIYYGQDFEITASAKTGYSFGGFYSTSSFTDSDKITSTSKLELNAVSAGREIYAYFIVNKYTVTINAKYASPISATALGESVVGTTGGTVLAEALALEETDGVYSIEIYYGQSISLAATAASGYGFDSWQQNGSSVSILTTIAITVNDNIEMDALFGARKQNLSLEIRAEQMATVTTVKDELANVAAAGALTGAGNYYVGFPVSISATAKTGYTFAGWFTDPECKVAATVTEGKFSGLAVNGTTLYAKFTLNRYTLTITDRYTSGEATDVVGTLGGTISALAEDDNIILSETDGVYTLENVLYGASLTLKATAAAGYNFGGWFSGSSSLIGSETNYEFTQGNADISMSAFFEIRRFNVQASPFYQTANSATTLNAAVKGENFGTISGTGSKYYHESVTLTATAKAGYRLEGWYKGTSLASASKIVSSDKYKLEGNTLTIGVEFMESDFALIALFVPQTIEINVNILTREELGGTIIAGNHKTGGTVIDIDNNVVYITDIFAAAGDTVASTEHLTSGFAYYGSSVRVSYASAEAYEFTGVYTENLAGSTEVPGASTNPITVGENAITAYVLFTRKSFTVKVESYSKTSSSVNTLGTPVKVTGVNNDNAQTVYYGQNYTVTAENNITLEEIAHVFAGWYDKTTFLYGERLGDGSTYELENITGDTTIYALYVEKPYELSISVKTKLSSSDSAYSDSAEGGRVSVLPDMINDYGIKGYFVREGRKVTVSANAFEGYMFDGFYSESGSLLSASGSYEYEMPKATTTIYARFSKISYNVAVNTEYQTAATPTTLNPATSGLVGGTIEGAGTYDHGENVTLTAKPSAGYMFEGWYVGDKKITSETAGYILGENSLTIDGLTADQTIRALFVPKQYQISGEVWTRSPSGINALADAIKSTAGGTILGGVLAYYGSDVTLTANPSAGYKFVGWFTSIEDMNNIPENYAEPGARKEISSVSGETTIYALFVKQVVSVIVETHDGTDFVMGNIDTTAFTGYGMEGYFAGHQITVSANIDPAQRKFVSWHKTKEMTDAAVSSANPYSFMLEGDAHLYGKTQPASKTISVENFYQSATSAITLDAIKSGATGGTVSGDIGTVGYGLNATLVASPAENYVFVGWFAAKTVDGEDITLSTKLSSDLEFTLENVTEDATYYALFETAKVQATISLDYKLPTSPTTLGDLQTYENILGLNGLVWNEETDKFEVVFSSETQVYSTVYYYYGQTIDNKYVFINEDQAFANFFEEHFLMIYEILLNGSQVYLTSGEDSSPEIPETQTNEAISISYRAYPLVTATSVGPFIKNPISATETNVLDINYTISNGAVDFYSILKFTNSLFGTKWMSYSGVEYDFYGNLTTGGVTSTSVIIGYAGTSVTIGYELINNGFNCKWNTTENVTQTDITIELGGEMGYIINVAPKAHFVDVVSKYLFATGNVLGAVYADFAAGFEYVNAMLRDAMQNLPALGNNNDGTLVHDILSGYIYHGQAITLEHYSDIFTMVVNGTEREFTFSHYELADGTVLKITANGSVTVDGKTYGLDKLLSLITGDTSIVAVYEEVNYSITVSSYYQSIKGYHTLNEKQLGTLGGSASSNLSAVYVGNEFVLTAIPAANYVVAGWYDASTNALLGSGNTLTISSIDANKEYYVIFIPGEYKITIDEAGGSEADDILVYTGWEGEIPLPTDLLKTDSVFKGFKLGTEDVTSSNLATLAANKDCTIVAQWADARKGTINYVARTPESMHKSNVTLGNINSIHGAVAFGELTTTTSDLSSFTFDIPAGYVLVGVYSSLDNLPTTKPSGEDRTTYTYNFTADDKGSNIELFAYFVPESHELIVQTWSKQLADYTMNITGGRVLIKIGETQVSPVAASDTGSMTYVTYYGGSYEFTANPNNYYNVVGFVTDPKTNETDPDFAPPAGEASAPFSITLSPYSSEKALREVRAKFESKLVDLTVSANGKTVSGATVFKTYSNIQYGSSLTLTLDFNAFAVEYLEHIGFAKTANATEASVDRGYNNFATNATLNITVNSSNITLTESGDKLTGTIYAVWRQPDVWVEYSTSSNYNDSTKTNIDSLRSGYSGDSAIVSAIESAEVSNATFSSVRIKVLNDTQLNRDVTIAKKNYSIKGWNVSTNADAQKTVSSQAKITINGAHSLFLSYLIITDDTTVDAELRGFGINAIGTGVNNLAYVGTEYCTFSSVTGKAKNGTIFNLQIAAFDDAYSIFENCTVGTAGVQGGVVYATALSTIRLGATQFKSMNIKGLSLIYLNESSLQIWDVYINFDGTNKQYATTPDDFVAYIYNENSTVNISGSEIYTNGDRAIYEAGSGATTETTDTIIDN